MPTTKSMAKNTSTPGGDGSSSSNPPVDKSTASEASKARILETSQTMRSKGKSPLEASKRTRSGVYHSPNSLSEGESQAFMNGYVQKRLKSSGNGGFIKMKVVDVRADSSYALASIFNNSADELSDAGCAVDKVTRKGHGSDTKVSSLSNVDDATRNTEDNDDDVDMKQCPCSCSDVASSSLTIVFDKSSED